MPGERCGQTTFPGRQQVGTLSGASSQARRTLPAYAPPLRGPARLDRSLEPRRSAVLISALATGPPAGVGGGSDRFWARELRVSQLCSMPGSLGYNGITVISEPNRLKSATLFVKIWRMVWTCIVATMFASWTCLPPKEYVLSKPAR